MRMFAYSDNVCCFTPLFTNMWRKPYYVQSGVLCTSVHMKLAPVYRYFVDSGFFPGPEQSTAVFLVAKNSGCNGLQQKSEEAAFPKSTEYRYSMERAGEPENRMLRTSHCSPANKLFHFLTGIFPVMPQINLSIESGPFESPSFLRKSTHVIPLRKIGS
jgi:hypothetical protein